MMFSTTSKMCRHWHLRPHLRSAKPARTGFRRLKYTVITAATCDQTQVLRLVLTAKRSESLTTVKCRPQALIYFGCKHKAVVLQRCQQVVAHWWPPGNIQRPLRFTVACILMRHNDNLNYSIPPRVICLLHWRCSADARQGNDSTRYE